MTDAADGEEEGGGLLDAEGPFDYVIQWWL